MSLTHGSAGFRQHIWSFASTVGDAEATVNFFTSTLLCPCSSGANWPYNTRFIGNDYFCDTGNHANNTLSQTLFSLFYPTDPLWDGAGCDGTSTCCQFNNPPWFHKTLPLPTTDDLEVRMCQRPNNGRGYTPILHIELYVQ